MTKIKTSSIEKILIVGAGGVGSYLGSQLIRNTNAEVTLLARGDHLAAICTGGLTVQDNDTTYTVHPHAATDDPSTLGVFDLIIVTLKATALEEVLPTLYDNTDRHTILLPLLNGVAHDATLRRYFPHAQVLDGHIYILSNITAPGFIKRRGQVLRLVWGKPGGVDDDTARKVSTLFDNAHIRHRHATDIRIASWRKFLFIASFAALTTRYDVPMDRIYAEHRDELENLMYEIITLAKTLDVPMTKTDIETALKQASQVAPGARTSLQLDIQAGKPAEIEALCGYIVHEGERLSINVKHMKDIYDWIINFRHET